MKRADLQATIKFFSSLLIILYVVFYGHSFILEKRDLWTTLTYQNLLKTYVFNGIITVVIFGVLMFLKEKHMASLGFFFLAGSLLKIILFFILFRPGYSEDGLISKLEFSEFFVPYGVCLFFEVYYLVKVLMKAE